MVFYKCGCDFLIDPKVNNSFVGEVLFYKHQCSYVLCLVGLHEESAGLLCGRIFIYNLV